jgi:hypothetical protein
LLQEECEARLKVLEEAAASAQRMTSHGDADITVGAFKVSRNSDAADLLFTLLLLFISF